MSASHQDDTGIQSVYCKSDTEDRLTSRRAALRKIGLTTGAPLFGLLAGDNLFRTVASVKEKNSFHSEIVGLVAKQFSQSGVALAQVPSCGDARVPCIVGGPCCGCAAPDCVDCMSIADYNKCNCLQKWANLYPACCDSNGVPLGEPGCVTYNVQIALCYTNHDTAVANCG